jgi:uncharacterized protein (DUF488 family)
MRNLTHKQRALLKVVEKSTEKGTTIKGINSPISLKIKRVINKFNSDREIKEYVYKNYKKYTIKTEIIPQSEKQEIYSGIFTNYVPCYI